MKALSPATLRGRPSCRGTIPLAHARWRRWGCIPRRGELCAKSVATCVPSIVLIKRCDLSGDTMWHLPLCHEPEEPWQAGELSTIKSRAFSKFESHLLASIRRRFASMRGSMPAHRMNVFAPLCTSPNSNMSLTLNRLVFLLQAGSCGGVGSVT